MIQLGGNRTRSLAFPSRQAEGNRLETDGLKHQMTRSVDIGPYLPSAVLWPLPVRSQLKELLAVTLLYLFVHACPNPGPFALRAYSFDAG